jgi:hypothetical protein
MWKNQNNRRTSILYTHGTLSSQIGGISGLRCFLGRHFRLCSTTAMMKLVFALVLATASANFVQLGRTAADDSSGDNYQWVDVTFPTAFTSTVRENEPAPFF